MLEDRQHNIPYSLHKLLNKNHKCEQIDLGIETLIKI